MPRRDPLPPGGANGNGAVVTVEHAATTGLDAGAKVSEALQVSSKAANRVFHALAFVARKHRAVPRLTIHDLEEVTCEEIASNTSAPLPLGDLLVRRPVRIDTSRAANATEDVQRLLDPVPATFSTAETLWADAIDAFYDGRIREAVVFGRAVVEVAWEAAATSAARDLARRVVPPIHGSVFEAHVRASLEPRVALQDRLDAFCKEIFGFSFGADWDESKWDQLKSFFSLRNDVAHEGFHPQPEQAWTGLSLTRQVFDKLVQLLRDVQSAPMD